eukprot:GILK01009730.1.p1 GENE.GILK01009730.1~~GILK01009730.1.p1  ORF type:complete len:236 (+),score=17.74 GILK01009730.1:59-766(+)
METRLLIEAASSLIALATATRPSSKVAQLNIDLESGSNSTPRMTVHDTDSSDASQSEDATPSVKSLSVKSRSGSVQSPISNPRKRSLDVKHTSDGKHPAVAYYSGIQLRLGGAGRELLKKKIRTFLKIKKHHPTLKQELDSHQISSKNLRKSTVAGLCHMAYICGLWEEAVKIHLQFLGEIPVSDEFVRVKAQMGDRESMRKRSVKGDKRSGSQGSEDADQVMGGDFGESLAEDK